ncbi:cyclic nucleotide-binding domain-containing protein [Aestuariicella hydrocarbonica]|uniref:Cyclic nucleotide-binding domain-containing protein n=1 Tax=Pseudomaricurvus hydrocarbonicus TaxID=1470433 RepID=A0A9E5JYS3_9GAMM|nr:cyclic nucleotide-binding domain-containing protein [Aestuariicella hydrocarbonica]NHO64712.1 cyclic nucleotide-binding domain-containing protein [Aestuariicella hydrocarbonica]
MSIKIKIARTAKELDDVFNLRYRVYVEEKGRFEGGAAENPRVVDHFDSVPGVVNIVAYSDGEAVGSMRVNEDTEIGLPAEVYFDFSEIRQNLTRKFESEKSNEGVRPVFVSGGMLAVHKDWRNRRNVIFALFKTAIGVMHDMCASFVICSISEETLPMYGRLGFKTVSKGEWKPEVGDNMIAIAAPFNKVFDWAFGKISKSVDEFWLDNFCGQFERILLSPGEVLFNQDDLANHTYAIDEGWIAISREDPNGNEMVLANLSRGALFGELAVFDGERRSAKASALVNTELISIERSHMFEMLKKNPDHMEQLLKHFAKRVRDTDNMAMVQAFAPQTGRVEFALNELWKSATPSLKNPNHRSIKVGPEQIARTSRVREDEVRKVLEMKKSQKVLDYGDKVVKFFRDPESDNELDKDNDSPI